MNNRIWKWTFRLFAISALLVSVGAIVLHFSLPAIVRHQVAKVLAQVGLPNATFNVDRASPYGIRISNLKAGPNGEMDVSSAQVDYAPLRAIGGRIDSLRIERANFVFDLNTGMTTSGDDSPASRPSDIFSAVDTKGLPLWRIELADCSITLVRGPRKYVVRADGWMWRERADRARISLQFRVANAPAWLDGSIDFTERRLELSAGANDIDLAELMPFVPETAKEHVTEASGLLKVLANVTYSGDRMRPSIAVELRDTNIVTAPAYGISLTGASAKVALQSLNPIRAEVGQTIDVKRLKLSEQVELNDVHLEFGAERETAGRRDADAIISLPDSFLVHVLNFGLAGGQIASAGPVVINPKQESAAITLHIHHVGVGEFLKLVSDGRASGNGSLSGELPIAVDWPRITLGTGQIGSDGPGDINFGEQVSSIAQTVAERDPRLKGQQQQLIAALTHFRYDQIVFEFERSDRGLQVTSRITGRGTQGIKTPIDLTMRYIGLEEALNAYLSTTLRVRSSED